MANAGKPKDAETAQPPAALVDVEAVAAMLSCSARHIYRLAEAGQLPRPVRLGALVRWKRGELEAWVEEGCPPTNLGGR